MGNANQAKLVMLLQLTGPMTVAQISDALQAHQDRVRKTLDTLLRADLVYVARPALRRRQRGPRERRFGAELHTVRLIRDRWLAQPERTE